MQPDFESLVRAGLATCRARGEEDVFVEYLLVSLRLAALRFGADADDAFLAALDVASAALLNDAGS